MMVNPALRIVASGLSIGTLGLAGAYKSVTTGSFVAPLNFNVYQNGITSRMMSTFATTAGRDLLIE